MSPLNSPPSQQEPEPNKFLTILAKPKAWLFIAVLVFVQIILPSLACYLTFSNLPWLDGATGVVITIVIFGLYFIGFFILQLKGQVFITEYLRKK
jgi:hypothetical protein